MRVIFDTSSMLALLRNFHLLTGLRVVVFDAEGKDILSYPMNLPDFCRMIRSDPRGSAACLSCDQSACALARRQSQPHIYTCHAGLTEVITPILAGNEAVGYLLLSHIVPRDLDELTWERVCASPTAGELPLDELKDAYRSLTRIDSDVLRAAADLLALATTAIMPSHMVSLLPGSPIEQLNRYLMEHLAEDLSSQQVCRALSVSRTSLYHLCRKAYGMGINEHVTQLRIQEAARLLANTPYSISDICARVGFSDYNYFFRVFRQHTGLTPKTYRVAHTVRQPAGDPAATDDPPVSESPTV